MKCMYLETSGESVTILQEPLNFYNWGCAIIQIHGRLSSKKNKRHTTDIVETSKKSKDLFLCCDLIEQSYVGTIKMPVLRNFTRNTTGVINENIPHALWLKVTRTDVSRIKLYITDRSGEIISFDKGSLKCTLLFIEHKE